MGEVAEKCFCCMVRGSNQGRDEILFLVVWAEGEGEADREDMEFTRDSSGGKAKFKLIVKSIEWYQDTSINVAFQRSQDDDDDEDEETPVTLFSLLSSNPPLDERSQQPPTLRRHLHLCYSLGRSP